MSKFDSSWAKKPQVTVNQKLLTSDMRCAPVWYCTWAESVAPAYYKLLSYFGRRDIGAHGLVCVPSVPETLSHSGWVGDHGWGDVIAPIKHGPDV